jgi:hypothetical protein
VYLRGNCVNPFSFRLFRELRRTDVIHCHQWHVLVGSAA